MSQLRASTSLGVEVGEAPSGVGPGSTVTLDLTRAKFFKTGSFFVNFASPIGKVPLSASDKDLEIIRGAVARGHLMAGEVKVQGDTEVDRLEEAKELVDGAHSPAQIAQRVISIASGGKRFLVPNTKVQMTSHEVLTRLVEHEARNKCRTDMINMIAQVMSRTFGAQHVRESVQDREVRVVSTDPNTNAAPRLEYTSMEGFEDLI